MLLSFGGLAETATHGRLTVEFPEGWLVKTHGDDMIVAHPPYSPEIAITATSFANLKGGFSAASSEYVEGLKDSGFTVKSDLTVSELERHIEARAEINDRSVVAHAWMGIKDGVGFAITLGGPTSVEDYIGKARATFSSVRISEVSPIQSQEDDYESEPVSSDLIEIGRLVGSALIVLLLAGIVLYCLQKRTPRGKNS